MAIWSVRSNKLHHFPSKQCSEDWQQKPERSYKTHNYNEGQSNLSVWEPVIIRHALAKLVPMLIVHTHRFVKHCFGHICWSCRICQQITLEGPKNAQCLGYLKIRLTIYRSKFWAARGQQWTFEWSQFCSQGHVCGKSCSQKFLPIMHCWDKLGSRSWTRSFSSSVC